MVAIVVAHVVLHRNQFHHTEFKAKYELLQKRKGGGSEWATTSQKYLNIEAARKVSVLGVLSGSLTGILDAFQHLSRQHFVIHPHSYLLITHRICADRFDGQQWTLALQAWWPVFLTAPGGWNTGSGACFAALKMPEDTTQLEVAWLKCFLND